MPASPEEVCTFWFGGEWASNRDALSSTPYFDANVKRWYGGGPEMDAACARYADTIHAAGLGELSAAPGWQPSAVSSIATVVLLDQMTRGAFRCVAARRECANARN